MACQAGKHVYVEKPLGTSIGEGRAAVKAARKYNRVVQLGTQQRSWPHYLQAAEVIQSGRLGEITEVKVWDYDYLYPGFGSPPDSDPPQEFGEEYWDFWLGPSPKRPYNPNRFLNWYWFFDYAGRLAGRLGRAPLRHRPHVSGCHRALLGDRVRRDAVFREHEHRMARHVFRHLRVRSGAGGQEGFSPAVHFPGRLPARTAFARQVVLRHRSLDDPGSQRLHHHARDRQAGQGRIGRQRVPWRIGAHRQPSPATRRCSWTRSATTSGRRRISSTATSPRIPAT